MAKWQTHQLEVLVLATEWRFESSRAHQILSTAMYTGIDYGLGDSLTVYVVGEYCGADFVVRTTGILADSDRGREEFCSKFTRRLLQMADRDNTRKT